MAEVYPAEAAASLAEYQIALQRFFDVTADDLQMRNAWITWAEGTGITTQGNIAYYRGALEAMADSNTTYAMEVMNEWRQAGLFVWVNEPGIGAHRLQGLQYTIGEPWYRAGIVLNGQPTMVPLDTQRTLEIREPEPALRLLWSGPGRGPRAGGVLSNLTSCVFRPGSL